MQLRTNHGFRAVHCRKCGKQERVARNYCQCQAIWHQCLKHRIDPRQHRSRKVARLIPQQRAKRKEERDKARFLKGHSLKRKAPVIEEAMPENTSSLTQKARKELDFKQSQNGSQQRMSVRVQAMRERIKWKEAERASAAANGSSTTLSEKGSSSKAEHVDSTQTLHAGENDDPRHRMKNTLSKANENGRLQAILEQMAASKQQQHIYEGRHKNKADVVRSRQVEQEEGEADNKMRKLNVTLAETTSFTNAAANDPVSGINDDLLEDIVSQSKKDEPDSADISIASTCEVCISDGASSAHIGTSSNRKNYHTSVAQLIHRQSTDAKRRRKEAKPDEATNSIHASASSGNQRRLHGNKDEVRQANMNTLLNTSITKDEVHAITALLMIGRSPPNQKGGPTDTHAI